MRNIVEIDRDLTAAREALAQVRGDPAEVYSRIVGYYRSVRNWNKGKKEEYGERKLYEVSEGQIAEKASVEAGMEQCVAAEAVPPEATTATAVKAAAKAAAEPRVLLFVQPTCPNCPSAKDAAGKLGIQVDTVNAATEAGLVEASKRNVFSTPTAILLAKDGREISRALDGKGIAAFSELVAG